MIEAATMTGDRSLLLASGGRLVKVRQTRMGEAMKATIVARVVGGLSSLLASGGRLVKVRQTRIGLKMMVGARTVGFPRTACVFGGFLATTFQSLTGAAMKTAPTAPMTVGG